MPHTRLVSAPRRSVSFVDRHPPSLRCRCWPRWRALPPGWRHISLLGFTLPNSGD